MSFLIAVIISVLILIVLIYSRVQRKKHQKLYIQAMKRIEELDSKLFSKQQTIRDLEIHYTRRIDSQKDSIKILETNLTQIKQETIDKIFKKLGPLIEETTIQCLAELGANKRAQKLSSTVIDKLKKELGVE